MNNENMKLTCTKKKKNIASTSENGAVLHKHKLILKETVSKNNKANIFCTALADS